MSGRGRTARALAIVLLTATAFLFSGCVYLRLLELKHQMAAFDANFAVATQDGIQITCKHPLLLDSDIRWFGLGPEKTKRVGTAEQWQVRWVKDLPPTVHESGAFDIVVNLLFVDHKLTRVSIPERYFAVMPKTLLVDLLRSLGGAKVNKSGRSVEAMLAAARPDLPGIEKLLGKPTSEVGHGPETVKRYRYVPVTTGLARSAVFDMAVHFDNRSGQMLRWEGQTPVGKIGFTFAQTEPMPSPPNSAATR